jgi:hypothetical protein
VLAGRLPGLWLCNEGNHTTANAPRASLSQSYYEVAKVKRLGETCVIECVAHELQPGNRLSVLNVGLSEEERQAEANLYCQALRVWCRRCMRDIINV